MRDSRPLALLVLHLATLKAQVVINEVSGAGSPNFCSGGDWVELANTDSEEVDLMGWKVCDTDGCRIKDLCKRRATRERSILPASERK